MNPESCPSTSLPSSVEAAASRSRSFLLEPPGDGGANGVGRVEATAVEADLALRTIRLLQDLVEKAMGQGEPVEVRKRRPGLRTYTPRSNVPLRQLAAPSVSPTRVRRRSLQFSCPCCGRETVVVRRQAGAKIRCPHCQAAVGAPHPARRRSAANWERDIEAVLRPDAFLPAVRPTLPRWVRVVVKEPLLILALAALVPFTILLMLEIPMIIDQARGGVPAQLVKVAPRPPVRGPADGAADRAVALVERFLAAPNAQAKAAWVRDPERVRLLMLMRAARQPEWFGSSMPDELTATGLTHYADPTNPVAVTPVVAQWRDGTHRTFFVEHSASGDAIEWESSYGYSEPLEWKSAVRPMPSSPARVLWRVEAAPDTYFNRGFSDESNLICLKIVRADQPGESFWAYAPKDSDVGAALQRIWSESPHDLVQRLTVTVEADPSSVQTRQLRLAEVHHAGWRTPDPRPPLVAGHPQIQTPSLSRPL